MTTSDMRYAERVRQLLLAADSSGITQHDLNQRSRTKHYNAKTLEEMLEYWRTRRWVERFTNRHVAKRPITIWRATDLLLTEWPQVTINLKLASSGEDALSL